MTTQSTIQGILQGMAPVMADTDRVAGWLVTTARSTASSFQPQQLGMGAGVIRTIATRGVAAYRQAAGQPADERDQSPAEAAWTGVLSEMTTRIGRRLTTRLVQGVLQRAGRIAAEQQGQSADAGRWVGQQTGEIVGPTVIYPHLSEIQGYAEAAQEAVTQSVTDLAGRLGDRPFASVDRLVRAITNNLGAITTRARALLDVIGSDPGAVVSAVAPALASALSESADTIVPRLVSGWPFGGSSRTAALLKPATDEPLGLAAASSAQGTASSMAGLLGRYRDRPLSGFSAGASLTDGTRPVAASGWLAGLS